MNWLKLFFRPSVKNLAAFSILLIIGLSIYTTSCTSTSKGYLVGYPQNYMIFDASGAEYKIGYLAADVVFWYLVACIIVGVCNIPCTLHAEKVKARKD
jgi:hypothetical protein